MPCVDVSPETPCRAHTITSKVLCLPIKAASVLVQVIAVIDQKKPERIVTGKLKARKVTTHPTSQQSQIKEVFNVISIKISAPAQVNGPFQKIGRILTFTASEKGKNSSH
ncbi:hypothetical protein TNCV_1406941 [Trichonephila clavipes]|nr:hypothetical protein TNCV_1406941 [Trichonephila clavipes]